MHQLQEQLQINLLQQTHMMQASAAAEKAGNGKAGGAAAAQAALQQLQLQQQQLISQLQLVQQRILMVSRAAASIHRETMTLEIATFLLFPLPSVVGLLSLLFFHFNFV